MALPLFLVVFFGGYFWLMHKTGSAFPGLSLLATREANSGLFGSYYLIGALALIGSAIWLAVTISRELLA